VAWVGCFGVFGGIMMCGDPESGSMCGKANYWLQITLPDAIHGCFLRFGGRPILNALGWVRTFFCWKPNPIVQILYLVLVVGGFGLFITKGYPLIPNPYFGGWHRYTGLLCMSTCLLTFVLASGTPPGAINKKNLKKFDVYPYDDVLYDERECSTCEVTKLARSKHCRVCDICVSRFDHHCIWLNNCVGERNYRWFLSFLLIHAVTLYYGMIAALSIIKTVVDEKGLLNATFVHRETGQKVSAGYTVIFQYLMFHYGALMGLLIMCVVMGTVLFGFWGYHMWLVRANTTTNESFKWGSVRHEHGRLTRRWHALRRQLKEARAMAMQQEGKDDDKTLEALGLHEATDGFNLLLLPDEPPLMPINVYNHGFWANLREIIRPRSLRPLDDPTRVAPLREQVRGLGGSRSQVLKIDTQNSTSGDEGIGESKGAEKAAAAPSARKNKGSLKSRKGKGKGGRR